MLGNGRKEEDYASGKGVSEERGEVGGGLESRAEGWSPKTSAHASKSQTL